MRLHPTGIVLLLFEGSMTFFPLEEHLWFLPPDSVAIKQFFVKSVLMRWMKLEPIIQSEVSQKEKHQYSILMHIYGI